MKEETILCAPRAKFDFIYILSPMKITSVFLLSLHCLFVLIAFSTSFWIETKAGFYGPLFRCEFHRSSINECHFGGFPSDSFLIGFPHTAFLILSSLILAMISMIIACLSFNQHSDRIRHRSWFIYSILLLAIILIDCFLLLSIPFYFRTEIYRFQWSYGVFGGGTLFSLVAFLMAILTLQTDEIHYIESIVH